MSFLTLNSFKDQSKDKGDQQGIIVYYQINILSLFLGLKVFSQRGPSGQILVAWSL